MIDLNKNQIFDPPIELEISIDCINWEIGKINEINHNAIWPFISRLNGIAYPYARISQPKTIDTTKAQVFDPPVKYKCSDNPDFPEDETFQAEVFCIYPTLKHPIRTIDKDGLGTPFKYAKPIEKQEDEFEKAWNDFYQEVCKEAARKFWERLKNE